MEEKSGAVSVAETREYIVNIADSEKDQYQGDSTPETVSVVETKPRRFEGVRCALRTASDAVAEWTPFLLVVSYFIFSVCIYMVANHAATAVLWFVYLMTNSYIAGSTVVEAFMSLTPSRDSRKAVEKAKSTNWRFPTPDEKLPKIDLVIVAYLPNEKDIILDRINYAVEKILYPHDKLRINIVYNTPTPIEPLETELRNLDRKFRHLRVIKAPRSKSKADNVNYYLSLNIETDVIAIFDCDHYPHPHAVRWAAERFAQDKKKKVDIVQGRCVVFNAASTFLAGMIACEFDKIYAVSHPGRSALWGFGLFCGSNGFWRAPLLRDIQMDGSMLTEDIDSALRAFAKGANTVHDLNVVSYELAPTTIQSFWKQRLRWAQGWAQASLRHVRMTYNKPVEGKRQLKARLGILSLLAIRETSYYFITQYLCLVISFIITSFPKTPTALLKLVFFTYPVSMWLFVTR
jgi:cellulose synthase/poly-beta-1,6-N-acetylglucosamine synthase-like glycosyltransferase